MKLGSWAKLLAGGLAAGSLWLFLGYEATVREKCPLCGSERVTTEWGVASLPLSETRRTAPSKAYVELFDESHAHEWKTSYAWTQRGLESSHVHGRPRESRFSIEYEADSAFRALVLGKVRAGTLTKEHAARLVSVRRPPQPRGFCPAHPPPEPLPPEPEIDPAHAELLAAGKELFAERFGTVDGADEWYWR